MTCSKCNQQFEDGQHITARVLSIYHVITKPEMDQFKYAVERPYACTDIQHLVCNE